MAKRAEVKKIRTYLPIIKKVNRFLLSSKVSDPAKYQRIYEVTNKVGKDRRSCWFHHVKSKISKSNDTAQGWYYMQYSKSHPLQHEFIEESLLPLFILSSNLPHISIFPVHKDFCGVNILVGLDTMRDGTYSLKNGKYDIKDKTNHKSSYKELSKINRLYKGMIQNDKDKQAFFLADPENNHRVVSYKVNNNIVPRAYTHPHSHSIGISLTNGHDSRATQYLDTKYLRHAVKQVTGYSTKPSSNKVRTIQWLNYSGNDNQKLQVPELRSAGTPCNIGYIGDGKTVEIKVPRHLPKDCVFYPILKGLAGLTIKVSDTFANLLASSLDINYMCEDFRAQFKDTDSSFYDFKHTKFSDSQLALFYKCQVEASMESNRFVKSRKSMMEQLTGLDTAFKLQELNVSCSYYIPIPSMNTLAHHFTMRSYNAQVKQLFTNFGMYNYSKSLLPLVNIAHIKNFKEIVAEYKDNKNAETESEFIASCKQIHFDLVCQIGMLWFYAMYIDHINHNHKNLIRKRLQEKTSKLMSDTKELAKQAHELEAAEAKIIHEIRYHRTLAIEVKSILMAKTYKDTKNVVIKIGIKINIPKLVIFGNAKGTPP